MYCPVDGMEYREGITRCPEHDVALVHEGPEIEQGTPLADRLTSADFVRAAFFTVVGAAVVYVLTTAILWGTSAFSTSQWWADSFWHRALGVVNGTSHTVGVGAFGCLAAGLLVRGHARLDRPVDASPPDAADHAPAGPAWVMPLLFALLLVFTTAWVGLEIATRNQEAEYQSQFSGLGTPIDAYEPSESFLELMALRNTAYTCALASFAVMGAETMRRADRRLRPRA